jgi:hypothetical protein
VGPGCERKKREGRRELERMGRRAGDGASRPCAGGPVVGLGRAVEGRKRESQLGWAARRKKREEKEKKRVGRAQRENEGENNCIQMHLNLNLNLKFKFKWKTNNKTMQCGMKCTKPIFPIFSFMVK